MFKIIAAISLNNSFEDLQMSLRKQLRELVQSGPGFSLNSESRYKSRDVYNYLKSEEFKITKQRSWHELSHPTKNTPINLKV